MSLAFIILFIFLILFSDFFKNVKQSLTKISNKLKIYNVDKIFKKAPKGILKKISFKEDKKEHVSCSDVEKMFNLDSDSETSSEDNERNIEDNFTIIDKEKDIDPDSETDCDESQKLEDTEDDLKDFMNDVINKD